MKYVILFLVTILVLLVPINIRDGPHAGLFLLPCYDRKVYTSISALHSQGYPLSYILQVYDNLGFVENSNTQAMRNRIEAAYLDVLGGNYDKRVEVCSN